MNILSRLMIRTDRILIPKANATGSVGWVYSLLLTSYILTITHCILTITILYSHY